MMHYFNLCCPIKNKNVSYKSKVKPWISGDLVRCIKMRQNFDILCKKGRMPRATFTRYRNYVTSRIRASKKAYYQRKFDECQNNIKKTWELINSEVKPGRSSNRQNISRIVEGSNEYTSASVIAEKLNNYFSTIGGNVSDGCPDVGGDSTDWLSGNYCDSFVFKQVTPLDIYKVINSFPNKSCHINSVPVQVYKFVAELISPILSVLVNKSIMNGVFPNRLKQARVVPLFKGGDSSSMINYRPISILSTMSKILERVMHIQLYRYFETKNILFSEQFGFRSKRGTTQSCNNLLQYIYNKLDYGENVLSVFMDFQKAFDSVNHDILLRKLYHYGIRGFVHDWLRSYLENRTQYVQVGNSYSGNCILSHGVPQGSILGPLLFLIQINDLPNSSNSFKFNLFADDSTITYSFNRHEVDDTSALINDELNLVYRWLCSNRIMINADKTKYIIFSYRMKIVVPPIKFGNHTLLQVENCKFLGLYLDEALNFESHVSHIARKMSKSIGILNKVKKIFPSEIMLTLYFSLIHPYIMYLLEFWYSAPAHISSRINILQKKSIRIVYNLPFNAHTFFFFIYILILCRIKPIYKPMKAFILPIISPFPSY